MPTREKRSDRELDLELDRDEWKRRCKVLRRKLLRREYKANEGLETVMRASKADRERVAALETLVRAICSMAGVAQSDICLYSADVVQKTQSKVVKKFGELSEELAAKHAAGVAIAKTLADAQKQLAKGTVCELVHTSSEERSVINFAKAWARACVAAAFSGCPRPSRDARERHWKKLRYETLRVDERKVFDAVAQLLRSEDNPLPHDPYVK